MPDAAGALRPGRGAALGAVALARRFLVALAGEGTQSAFHFLVNLLLMRTLPAYEYGLFAIIFTLGGLALTYSHALVSIPASVYLPRLRSPGAADFQDVVFGSVGTAIAAGAGLLAAAGLAIWGAGAAVALASGLFVGLWSLRNACRTALFARRRPAQAARSDLAFAGTGLALVAGLFTLQAAPETRLLQAFGALSLANAVGIAAALLAYPRRVRVSARASVRRRYRLIWRQVSWSLVGVTTANVQAQCQTFLVALLAGPAAFAPIAAALVLVAPLRLVVSALIFMAQPEFAAGLATGGLERVRELLVSAFGLLTLACLGYGVALWLGFDVLRAHVFGPGFAREPMGLITALAWGVAVVYLGYNLPKALIEAAGGFRTVANATLVSAVVGVAAVSILLALTTAAWSLAGVIAAELVTLALFWIGAFRIVRQAPAPRG